MRPLPTLAVLLCAMLLPAQQQQKQDKKPPEKAPNPRVLIKTSLGDITAELFADAAPRTVANFVDLAEGLKRSLDPKTGKMTKRNFYDGVIFHRVLWRFMAQAGCPLGTGRANAGFQFDDEINAKALGLDKIMVYANGQLNSGFCYLSDAEQQTLMRPICDDLGITTEVEFRQRWAEVLARLEKMPVVTAYKSLGFTYDDSRPSYRMQRGTLAMANSGPNTNSSQFFINFKNNEYLNGRHTVFGKVIDGMKVVDQMQTVKTNDAGLPETPIKILSIRVVPVPSK